MSNRIYSLSHDGSPEAHDRMLGRIFRPVAPRILQPDDLPRSTQPPRLAPGPRRYVTPSGLQLEVMPPRPQPLWPLVAACLLVWAAVAWGVWYILSN